MNHFLAYVQFFLYAHYLVCSVAIDHEYVIYVGACESEFLILETGSYESSFRVKVETFVCLGYFRCLDRIEGF